MAEELNAVIVLCIDRLWIKGLEFVKKGFESY